MHTLKRYFHDSSGHSLVPFFSKYVMSSSFYAMLILSGVAVVTWPWQGFVTFMQEQRTPYTFFVVGLALLATQTYLHLRIGRGEIGINYYFTREKIHQQYLPTEILMPFLQFGFPRACLQILTMLLPFLPILLLVVVVSGVSLLTLLKTLSVVFTASLICRLWGFFVYELWGNSSVLGYFLVRAFLGCVIYLSAFLKVPVSPFSVLYRINVKYVFLQRLPITPYMFYMLMAFGWIGVLIFLCEWRGRHHRRKEMSS